MSFVKKANIQKVKVNSSEQSIKDDLGRYVSQHSNPWLHDLSGYHQFILCITGYWLRFYVPLDTKQVISETFAKPISWLGIEKQNLTQQKHTFTSQKVLQDKINTKLKPGLDTSYDIQPGNRESLFWFCSFINWSLTYLLRHLPINLQPETTWGMLSINFVEKTT